MKEYYWIFVLCGYMREEIGRRKGKVNFIIFSGGMVVCQRKGNKLN